MRANHGKPAVKFEGNRFGPGYELHGVDARNWYSAQAKALASLEALKVKLRGEP